MHVGTSYVEFKGIVLREAMMLYSAGECPVCGVGGDALFVKDRASGRVFFLCPSCGCAWLSPPRPHEVETADPPELFAPHGLAVPTRAEIVAQGWEGVMTRDVDDDEWMGSLEDFLGEGRK